MGEHENGGWKLMFYILENSKFAEVNFHSKISVYSQKKRILTLLFKSLTMFIENNTKFYIP